jgi:UDP-N-acetyl-D-mannosaminuronate dehydrogenase
VTEQDRPGGQQDRRVAVIGLGYVGLPLAISFAEAGLRVEGVDAYQARVDELDAGHSPIDDVSDERLAAALAGTFRVMGPEQADLAAADAIFVCVPTPITTTKDPDLAPVLAAARTSTSHSRPSVSTPATRRAPARACRAWSELRARPPPSGPLPSCATSTTTW